jgi:hypothetical protein
MVCKRGEDITGLGPADTGLNNKKKTIKMTRTFRINSLKLYGNNLSLLMETCQYLNPHF